MAKNPKQYIKEAKDTVKEIMQTNLAKIAEAMIKQIIAKASKLTPSTMLNAISDIDTPGLMEYKATLQTALAMICLDAIAMARKEVPKAKNVRLAEWHESDVQLAEIDKLPPALRNRIIKESNLLVGTQIADLEKNIYFQFTSSHDSIDSIQTIKQDLEDAADDYVRGPGMEAAAGLYTAKYVNTARNAFFFDDDVVDEIDGFVFMNGDPVTQICQDLTEEFGPGSGNIIDKNDPNLSRYQPPLHWNCKSWIAPILKGNQGSKEFKLFKPSSAKLEAQIQFSEEELSMAACASCGCHPNQ